jgi:hypothetical protein
MSNDIIERKKKFFKKVSSKKKLKSTWLAWTNLSLVIRDQDKK